jgi:hypothetical protein
VVAAEPASAANLRSQRAVHVAASPPPKVAWKLLRGGPPSRSGSGAASMRVALCGHSRVTNARENLAGCELVHTLPEPPVRQ